MFIESEQAIGNAAHTASEAFAPNHTIYVLVRLDIGLAQQLVQAAHAAAEAGRSFYQPGHGVARLVVLEVADLEALMHAREYLRQRGIACEAFFEPDEGMGYSALATQPLESRRRSHLRRWRLWRPALTGSAPCDPTPTVAR